MATPKTNGVADLSFQGDDFSFDPRAGITLGNEYKGPVSVARLYAFGLFKNRIPFSYKRDGPYATVTLHGNTPVDPSSPNEVPIDKWDLKGNEVQADIRLHPNSIAIEHAAPGALKQIDYDVKNMNLTGVATQQFDANGKDVTVTLPVAGDIAAKILALKTKLATGAGDQYDISRPILRHTYIITDAYAGSAFDFDNAEKIYTTEQLFSECAKFPYPLPAPYILAIKSIPAQAAPGYTFGWKKTPPDGVTAARFKNEVVTEYRCDLWDTSYAYSAR